MEQLWKRYFENQVEYAEVAKDKKLALLEEEKSYLQSVANAAIKLLDMQIDELEEQKDAAVQGLKDQIEVIEKQKEALQDQLDYLEKQREEREIMLNIQKEQYNLSRAENQRNQYKFVNGQMVYDTDDNAIKEAKENLDDAKFELTKFNIQQQIDAYDEQIEKLNELIEQTEKYYDDQIKGLQKYKDEWQKAIDLEELAINMQNFIDKFGENGIAKLLTGDMSLIQDWKQSYLDTLAEIDVTSTGTIGNITTEFAKLAGIDLSNTVYQTGTVNAKVGQLNDSVNKASFAIDGNDNSLTSAVSKSYDVASEKIPAETKMMDEFTDSATLASNEVTKISDAINALPDEKTITINVKAEGNLANLLNLDKSETSVGNAFADGTQSKGTVHDEKNALRSEYGQPELTVYPNGKAELTTEPTMSDLPKDTVIYNHKLLWSYIVIYMYKFI